MWLSLRQIFPYDINKLDKTLKITINRAKLEEKKLPSIDFKEITGLRLEAIEKLNKIRPENIGQASRISGVTPADVSVLLVYLEQQRLRKQSEK